MAVDVAGGHANDDRGHSCFVALDGAAVGPPAGDGGKLQGDALLLGRVNHQVAQAQIGDHAAVINDQRRPLAQLDVRLVFFDAGHVAGNVRFEDDGDVGVDLLDAGGSAPQPDFFLHRGRGVNAVGVLVVLKMPQDLYQQRATQPVVKGLGKIGLAAGKLHELGIGNHRVARAHARGLGLLFGGGADVNVHLVFDDDFVAFFGQQDVRGLGANDAYHVPLLRLDDDALPQ